MVRAIVLAVDPARELFAAEAENGTCGVFWVITGPIIQPADMLEGDAFQKGHCSLQHPDGISVVTGEAVGIGRNEALRLVRRQD